MGIDNGVVIIYNYIKFGGHGEMVKDDRINDLVIYLGRKYDKVDLLNKVCRGAEIAGLVTTVGASLVGAASVFNTIANSGVASMPSSATVASVGVVAGGLALHAISKRGTIATKNNMEQRSILVKLRL